MVTTEELDKALPDLPKNYQKFIRRVLPDIGGAKAENVVAGDENCFMMGHSFFGPVADGIQAHAHRGGFKDHRSRVFKSGAASGAPYSLWKNEAKRRQVQVILDGGGIETFGMTFFPEIPGHPHIGPEFEALEGYENWVKYAVKSNPDLKQIFIAVSWDYYTDRITRKEKPQSERVNKINAAVAKMESHIDILRKRFPSITFQCIPYGFGAYELEKRLRTGDLPGIKHRLSPDKGSTTVSIYKDKTGHPAPILVELSELIWLRALYGVDLVNDHPDYESEYDLALLKQIAMDVMNAHEDKYGVPRSGEEN